MSEKQVFSLYWRRGRKADKVLPVWRTTVLSNSGWLQGITYKGTAGDMGAGLSSVGADSALAWRGAGGQAHTLSASTYLRTPHWQLQQMKQLSISCTALPRSAEHGQAVKHPRHLLFIKMVSVCVSLDTFSKGFPFHYVISYPSNPHGGREARSYYSHRTGGGSRSRDSLGAI